ncbi:MAG: energy-coupling factor ABC transporter ATP-binding protein [Ruminococcaceae bacterium]|nr:energy-coupling factor ABC transporter ATP-binding protein [Oscillospiraceae bacterium]
MEIIKIKNLNFTYPERQDKTLKDISLSVYEGEFLTVIGKSGCGKTTLLRLLKPLIAPFGNLEGEILYKNCSVLNLSKKESATSIGFVMQNPDNQIVTDKVWHELAFGLENLGLSQNEIRLKVSEMASFFGIEDWFYKKCDELSGGQKQILNLASIMVMQPDVLVLDEPTSQLDPISANEFLKILEKINQEFGTTVIISEHRLEDVFPISDRVAVLEDGKIIFTGTPKETGEFLKGTSNDLIYSLPSPMRVYLKLDSGADFPVTIREGKKWLKEFCKDKDKRKISRDNFNFKNPVITLKDVYFKYDKNSPFILKGLNEKIYEKEIFSILGGNGAGKTTLLSLISSLNKPFYGKISVKEGLKVSYLPQNPQELFVKNTVYLDLEDILDKKLSEEEKKDRIKKVCTLCKIDSVMDFHPYDLSGGEQQRAALSKVLLNEPDILLLDEPTKGLDASFKEMFKEILKNLTDKNITVIMVSHDIEFCASVSTRCALMFDGIFTTVQRSEKFFMGNSFYTTSANKMARGILDDAVTDEDIIKILGGIINE